MQAVAIKDRSAFTQLVERHVDRLFNYAYRLSSSRDFAEDLVQDTWLLVWEKATRYSAGRASFTTWLFRVLHNRYIDLVRRQRPLREADLSQTQLEGLQQTASEVDDQDAELAKTRRFERYYQALYKLPPDQRAALLLAQVQGFSNAEIGSILSTSVRAVESQQARGRRALRAALEQSERATT